MMESHTAVLDRNVVWSGRVETEPYEAAWASEATFFVRVLEAADPTAAPVPMYVEVSPDGMRWCQHGAAFEVDPAAEISHVPVTRFAGWLRLVGEVPPGADLTVIAYLNLKG